MEFKSIGHVSLILSISGPLPIIPVPQSDLSGAQGFAGE